MITGKPRVEQKLVAGRDVWVVTAHNSRGREIWVPFPGWSEAMAWANEIAARRAQLGVVSPFQPRANYRRRKSS